MVVLKLCGEALALTVLAGLAVGVIGYVNKWDTALEYSNAFFFAACLVIIAGTASRLGAGQGWEPLQRLNAVRAMSESERADSC
jgi:FtsH-binding integral membrane protein